MDETMEGPDGDSLVRDARDSLPTAAAALGVLIVFAALTWAFMARDEGVRIEDNSVHAVDSRSRMGRGDLDSQTVAGEPTSKVVEPMEVKTPIQAATVRERLKPVIDLSVASAANSGNGNADGSGSIFDQDGIGTRVVYVIDRSGSMFGDLWNTATAELKKSLRALTEDKKFFVIFYNEGMEAMPAPGLLPATDTNKARIIEWIESVTPKGETDPTQALKRALGMAPDTVWLLTDGDFPESVADAVRRANENIEASVNTIAFADRSGETLLTRIARENNGEYRFISRR